MAYKSFLYISLRLTEREGDLFKRYADINGITVSELIRQSVTASIEDKYDLQAYDKAYAAYQEDPTTYSHEEVKRMLELD